MLGQSGVKRGRSPPRVQSVTLEPVPKIPKVVAKKHACAMGECTYATHCLANLVVHRRKHTREKPFTCDVAGCGRAFAASGGLGKHKRRHAGIKNFVCDVGGCKRTFAESPDLAKHKRRAHTGDKPFICGLQGCEYAGATSGDLNQHKRTHTGLRPFVCTLAGCGRAFAGSGDLVKHKRTHTGDKPYTCDVEGCKRSFAQSSALFTHKRVHTDDRPYVCDVSGCAKSFRQSWALTVHAKTHSEEKPYSCENCPYAAKDPSTLRKHLIMHERQAGFKFGCIMQDGGTQPCAAGDIACTIRCETAQDMEYHVQRNHTLDGIGAKLESETKLAKFFDANQIPYDRDWVNLIKFTKCENIEGKSFFARPDFYLPAESARMNAIVLVGNDEFAHRQYPCDFRRTYNIAQALGQAEAHRGLPIVYFRFNPHFFKKGETHYDMPLAKAHELLLRTIRRVSGTQLNKPDGLNNLAGLNLVYINYDRDEHRKLRIFQAAKEEGNDFGELLLPCVIASI